MSKAYYNEFDPYAAQWLRNLIAAGHIAPGDVDQRSIEDVAPLDLTGYTQCHFFAGVGVWSLALRRAGWSDSRPVWTGSCPCQPFSAAGKGNGFADERHLWPAWLHLIGQRSQPRGIIRELPQGVGALQTERRPTGPVNGRWSDADWIFCRDGKWRPVEPGTFPLANGAPARVGRLRAYGNAINAEAAEAVIRAYMECRP